MAKKACIRLRELSPAAIKGAKDAADAVSANGNVPEMSQAID